MAVQVILTIGRMASPLIGRRRGHTPAYGVAPNAAAVGGGPVPVHIWPMVWDLRGALLKKQEVESARLAEFEFRHRVLTFRMLAREMGLDEAEMARRVASSRPDELLAELAASSEMDGEAFDRLYQRIHADARRQLIAEIGDPSPYRLL